MQYLEEVSTVLARTRIRLAAEQVARVERVAFDGDGAAYLVIQVNGVRFVVFDAWAATSKTRVSGPVHYRPDQGRLVGLPTRGRLDYDSTPKDHGDWRNVPDAAWDRMKAFAADQGVGA